MDTSVGYTQVPHSLISVNETSIDLSWNKLIILNNDEFSIFTSLSELLLSHNSLNGLHEEAFLDTQIKVLDLGYNYLEELPNVTTIRDTLEELNLHTNKIQHISPELLLPLVHLRKLDLRHNEISQLLPRCV